MRNKIIIVLLLFVGLVAFALTGCEDKFEESNNYNNLNQEKIINSGKYVGEFRLLSEKDEYIHRVYEIEEGVTPLNNYIGINQDNQLVSIITKEVICDTYANDAFIISNGKKIQNVYAFKNFTLFSKEDGEKKYIELYHMDHFAFELEIEGDFELYSLDIFENDSNASQKSNDIYYDSGIEIFNDDKTFYKLITFEYDLINDEYKYQVTNGVTKVNEKCYSFYGEKDVVCYYKFEEESIVFFDENEVLTSIELPKVDTSYSWFQLKDKLVLLFPKIIIDMDIEGYYFYEIDLSDLSDIKMNDIGLKKIAIESTLTFKNEEGGFSCVCISAYHLSDKGTPIAPHVMYVMRDKLDFEEKAYEEYLFSSSYKINSEAAIVFGTQKIYKVTKDDVKEYDFGANFNLFGVIDGDIYFSIGNDYYTKQIDDFLQITEGNYGESVGGFEKMIIDGEVRILEERDGKKYLKDTDFGFENSLEIGRRSNILVQTFIYGNKVYTYNGKEVILECDEEINLKNVSSNDNYIIIVNGGKTYLIGRYKN